jgi:hypothetical protein
VREADYINQVKIKDSKIKEPWKKVKEASTEVNQKDQQLTIKIEQISK